MWKEKMVNLWAESAALGVYRVPARSEGIMDPVKYTRKAAWDYLQALGHNITFLFGTLVPTCSGF